MKTRIIFSAILVLLGFAFISNAQQNLVPFDSTWYGFNTLVGNQTYFLSSAKLIDLDNDGDLDVVASKYWSGFSGTATGFVVLKNDGAGFFNATPVHYSSPRTSGFVETADFNNDGFEDIVVSNTGQFTNQGNSISVYLNQGNGTFGSPASYTVGTGPQGIAAADFNGDGTIDLAVTNYYIGWGNTISVLINAGGGVFSPAVTYPAGESPRRIVAAKINSDNLVDLIVAGGYVNGGATVNVLINAGNGTFPTRTEYSVANSRSVFPSVAVADADNDGDNDILFPYTDFTNGPMVNLYRNQGNGTFTAVAIPRMAFSGSTDIKVADLNGDGWMDMINAAASARTSDGYEVFINNGSGGFLPSYKNPAGQNTEGIMLGDVDNDGWIDILTADSYSMQITVHKNFGQGRFFLPHLYETESSIAGSVDAADIDGDGDLDVVTSASGSAAVSVAVKVQKNLGNGVFGPPSEYSVISGGVQAKFRDLNGDNMPDLLFASGASPPTPQPYDFHYAINNGDGTFGSIQTKSLNSCGWYDIDALDLNNDGLNDVVLTENGGCPSIPLSGTRIYICLNNGNGTFADPIIKFTGVTPQPLAVGDFNEDGKLDVVVGVQGAGIQVHLGIGNGDLLPRVEFSIGQQGGARDIVVTDLNNDGHFDIASCNQWETTNMSILFGNGDGTFQPAVIFPSAYSPDLGNVSGIAVGDMDNDGDKDILVGHHASNSFSLYTNNNGTFSFERMRIGGYWGVSSPFFADFDGDGKGDLLAVGSIPPSGLSSTLVFLRGKNTGPTSVSQVQTLTPDEYRLGQNYPNPFNPTTKINFGIPKFELVTLKIYDILGKEVATLMNEIKNAGSYTIDFNGSSLSSGIYFYKLSTADFSQTRKMILLR